jgi:hypothetical protein
MGYCLAHLPEELLPEAESRGYIRCTHLVGNPDNPNFGERCQNGAMQDSKFCPFHQPKDKWVVPQTIEQNLAVTRIHRIAKEEGIDTTSVANPLAKLLEIAAEAVAFKEELARRVVALEAHEWRYEHVAGEQIRGDILLYERAIDRAARMLMQITRLGIEERLARVTERQAVIVEQAIVAALEESGATQLMQDKARDVVAKKLRAAI